MAPVEQLYSLGNPVFASFAFYGTITTAKMLAMAALTSVKRMTSGTFANNEDAAAFKGKVKFDQDGVERVRRNHLNDLENIPAFLALGLLYITTRPDLSTALWHFRIFTFSRLAHTLAYQLAVPQPARALTFLIGLATCVSMAYQTLKATGGL